MLATFLSTLFNNASRRTAGPSAWLRAFWPSPVTVSRGERLRVVCGAAIGILFTGALCHLLGAPAALPWLVAPMGASAVLVFGVPASPMAQPWAVVAGNSVSALAGIACTQLPLAPELQAALAVGLAVAAMFSLRCLHPPGGASALLVALGGVTDPVFALFPVATNSLLMVLAGIAYNNLGGRRYPHMQLPPAAPVPRADDARTIADDLDAVLARYDQVLDVSRDDLQALIEQTQLRAYRRKLAGLRCRDIMSADVITVEFGTPLDEAWTLLREHRIKALPVVDRARRIIGIVTLADFMRCAGLDGHDGIDRKLRELIRKSGLTHTTKPEVVGQIMTRQVRVASEDRHLSDLVPLFGSTGHHHIPVIGARERLVGIITQSDVVAALCRAGEERAGG